jgi:hypothetical protein
MRSTGVRFVLQIVTVLLLCTSCKNGIINPHDPTSSVTTTTSTLNGFIVDERGLPMSDVVVTAHGRATRTDSTGAYVFVDLTVPSERACVFATKDGYYPAARAQWPAAQGTTHITFAMQRAAITAVLSSDLGGTVQCSGASLRLPAQAFTTRAGTPYTGPVNVAAAYLTPDSATTFASFFAGDATALRTDNSQTHLVSYGVLRVVLSGSSGEPLTMKPGATATLTYPIPSSLAASQPSEIPLWYFDEAQGMWREDGQASLRNNVYVGTVSHFTDWNLDSPRSVAYMEGIVRCTATQPVGGAVVTIGQVFTRADGNGFFHARVPANETFAVVIDGDQNEGVQSKPMLVGPIAVGATQSIDLLVDACPTILEGTIVDCDDKPIAGWVQIVSSLGKRSVSTSNGAFQIEVPGGVILKVAATSIYVQPSMEVLVPAIPSGTTYSIGALKTCSNERKYIDLPIGSSTATAMTYTDNGATLAVLDKSVVKFFNATTGSLQKQILLGSIATNDVMVDRIMFSADGSVMMVVAPITQAQVYRTATGEHLCTIDDSAHTYRNEYLTADGRYVIAERRPGAFVMLDALSGQLMRSFRLPMQSMRLIGLQRGGERFVAAKVDGLDGNSVTVWDVATDSTTYEGASYTFTDSEIAVASPDGTVVFIQEVSRYTNPGWVAFYDLKTGKKINTKDKGRRSEYHNHLIVIAPDNQRYAYMYVRGSSGNQPKLGSVVEPSSVTNLDVPDSASYSIAPAFSPDSKHLAVVIPNYGGGIIRIYNF